MLQGALRKRNNKSQKCREQILAGLNVFIIFVTTVCVCVRVQKLQSVVSSYGFLGGARRGGGWQPWRGRRR